MTDIEGVVTVIDSSNRVQIGQMWNPQTAHHISVFLLLRFLVVPGLVLTFFALPYVL